LADTSKPLFFGEPVGDDGNADDNDVIVVGGACGISINDTTFLAAADDGDDNNEDGVVPDPER